MNPEELIAERARLVRPCLLLRERRRGSAPCGFWGGEPVLKPEPGPWRYWLTICCDWLAEHGVPLRGILSLYTNEEDCLSGVIVHDPNGRLPQRVKGGIRLFGHEGISFPPTEAFLQYGSPALQKCLQSENTSVPEWSFLEKEYQKHCPLYDSTDSTVALLGGWHHPWPDGDWQQLTKKRFVLWTFRNSEPWVEVWLNRSGKFEVLQRIT